MSSFKQKNGRLIDNVEKSVDESGVQENKYYKKVARRYKLAKYITIFVLGVFLIVALVWGSKYITMDNIMYLFRDFSSAPVDDLNNLKTIKYSSQLNNSYDKTNGKLCAIGSDLIIYASNGKLSLETNVGYTNPVMKNSSKYILVYDAGSTNYSIYNSVARVARKTADDIIVDAKISDSGAYALVTKSNTSKFKVSLFSSQFKLVAEYYKDSYVSDIAIDNKGEKILITSYTMIDYNFTTTVQLYSSKSETPLSNLSFVDSFPYMAKKSSNGWELYLDDKLVILDNNGAIKNTVSYVGKNLLSVASNDKSILLVFEAGELADKSEVLLLDNEGDTIYLANIDAKVIEANLDKNDNAYLLSNSEYFTISKGKKITENKCSYDTKNIVVFDGFIYLCTPSSATPVVTKK